VGSPLTVGFKMMIRPQFGRGQAIRLDETLQINKQLQGHLTNFFPVGAERIGVASLQAGQLNESLVYNHH
jgi:hypothetical protein